MAQHSKEQILERPFLLLMYPLVQVPILDKNGLFSFKTKNETSLRI